MVLGEMEDKRPWAGLTPPGHPHNIRPHPTCRRMWHPLTCLVGKRGLMRCERMADAVFHGRLHSPAHRHHHEQRHEAFGLVAIARGGQNARVFHQAKAAFRLDLASITVQKFLRCQWGMVAGVGGQDNTTVLIKQGVAGRERGRSGPVALVHHLIGGHASPRSSPLIIARGRAHRAGIQDRRLSGLLEGRKRLTRIGFARTGGAASCLDGVDLLRTLLV
jgi:hypothetical protein